MMERFFLFLTIALDAYPWLFLQYLPFRGQLRLSFAKTMACCACVLLLWELGFLWIAAQSWYTPDIMLAWRMCQLALLGVLTWLHIRSPFAKNAFVFGLLFPCTILVLAIACFLTRFLPPNPLPPYGAVSLLRLGLSVLLFPFLWLLWRRVLIPVMNVQEDGVWKSVWPIPTAFTLIGLCYTGNDFELRGVGLSELLGRATIFAGALLSCLVLFRMIRQAEARIRSREEAERSRLLLKLQAEQYQAMTRQMESTRRARHDLRQHLTVIYAMAAQGDCEAVKSYAAQLSPTEAAPLALCEHPACNALLCHYVALARNEGVAVETQVGIPRALRIEECDLAIVLGNLLENALEANRDVAEGARQISIRARAQGSRLFLLIANPCGADDPSDGGQRSRKRAYREPGVGLTSVAAVVRRYDGDMKIDCAGGRFTVSVMMKEN